VGNGTLELEVRDVIIYLSILEYRFGYAAGDLLDFDIGIKIAVGSGT